MDAKSGIVVYDYMDTFYCCMVEKDKWCEEMVTEHMLVYLCSGEMELISPEKRYHLKKGDAFFIKRNHLLRKIKQPSKNGEPFKGLFLQLKMPFLKKMLSEHQIIIPLVSNPGVSKATYMMLEKHPFLKGLFVSLEQYFDAQQYPSKELMEAKLKEAVFTLLQLKPDLGSVLFDFAEPWKIDLADFMNKNYKCDLSVEEFAHYTGRSLSSFKKDFSRIFNTTPGRWIVRKRLEEAKFLMDKYGEKPADVYLKVGFKNLSHFSTAFKKEFGFPPSVAMGSAVV
ncbi:AraC family transcriptional regulator [Phocaeicola sp.]